MRLYLLLAFGLITICSFGRSVNANGEPTSREEAETLQQRAVEMTAEWSFSSLLQAAEIYVNLGRYYRGTGNDPSLAYESDLEQARVRMMLGETGRAKELFESAIIGTRSNVNDSTWISANCEKLLMEISEGKAIDQALLDALEKSLAASPGRNSDGMIYLVRAEIAYFRQETKDSIRLYQAAVERVSSSDPRLASRFRLELGFAYLADSNFDEAIELFRSLAHPSSSSEGLGKRTRTLALIGLGHAYNQFNDERAAIDSYEEADANFPDNVEPFERAKLQNGLGRILEEFGELQAALSYRKRAADNLHKIGHVQGEAFTSINIAILSHKLGDDAEANTKFDYAFRIFEASGDSTGKAVVHAERGNIYLSLQEYQSAASSYRRAQAFFAKDGNGYMVSMIRSGLARVSFGLGEFESAKKELLEVLELQSRIRDMPGEADTLYQIARIERQLGNHDAAIAAIEKSVGLTEAFSEDITNAQLRQSYISEAYDRYELYLMLQLGNRAVDENSALGLEIAERSRSRSLVESFGYRAIASRGDVPIELINEERSLLTTMSAKADLLTTQLGFGIESEQTRSLEGEVQEIRVELEEIRSKIRSIVPDIATSSDDVAFDVRRFQSEVLNNDDVLIEYFLGDEAGILWLVGKDQTSTHLLPAGEVIRRSFEKVIDAVKARRPVESETFEQHRVRVAEADERYTAAARDFSKVILGPVADKIAGKRLLVVPDGVLNYFPISALPIPDSPSDAPLLLTNEIIYQPSARSYSLIKTVRPNRAAVSKNLLVFSDPVFSRADSRLAETDAAQGVHPPEDSREVAETVPYRLRLVESFSSLKRLPASRSEAQAVSNAVGQSDLFMGFEATRESLLGADLTRYRAIHLATHGFLDPERPELSSLVFSRYDETGKQIPESLRMHDISSMALSADLVVLSACETGIGKEIKGEGVAGLHSAFLQAGARSVVSTLWQVEDNASNELMMEFYTRMVDDGMSPASALRSAQIKLFQDPQFRSPFFWAAFTVHGDASSSTPFEREQRWPASAGLALATLIGLVVALYFRRRRHRTSNG